ncbi:heterokaryon incompatibility protein-domain-containing protein [Xylariaceae sp. FL0255]|nr:heterokaryon incompatibility protein-domain-containing protein [Xylariaceae sp. FL0255]
MGLLDRFKDWKSRVAARDTSLSQRLERIKREKYATKGVVLPPSSVYPDFSEELCFVCRLFIGDIWTKDAWEEESMPWWSGPDDIGKSMFQHHCIWDMPTDLDELSCILCRMLTHAFRQTPSFLSADGPDERYGDHIYIVRYFGRSRRSFQITALGDAPDIQFDFNVPIQYGEGKVDPYWSDDYCKEHGYDEPTPQNPGGEYKLLEHSGSSSVVSQIKQWMNTCAESHDRCQKAQLPLPSRVIDVGHTGDDTPRLYVSKRGEVEPYTALSYCWGKGQSDVLTEGELGKYQVAIPDSALPTTVLDAIRLTREIGLRYIWVDALCIIQDSKEDWKKEAAMMRRVYQGATLTIAGLESHSKIMGLFRDRTVRVTQAPIFEGQRHLVVQRERRVQLNTTVLRKRAWTLQEQILSSATVYFSGSSLVWECDTCVVDEDEKDHNSVPHLKWFEEAPDETGSNRLWYKLCQDYTARSITYQSDRVAAIAGLADQCEVEKWQQGSYMAGLWIVDLPHALLWTGSVREQTENRLSAWWKRKELAASSFTWDLPSWSWLSNPRWVSWPDSFIRQEVCAETEFCCKVDPSRITLTPNDKTTSKGVTGLISLSGYIQPFTDHLLKAVASHDVPPFNELCFSTLKAFDNSGAWRSSRNYLADRVQPWMYISLEIGWKALIQPVYLLRICSWPTSRSGEDPNVSGSKMYKGNVIDDDYLDTYFLLLEAVNHEEEQGTNQDATWSYNSNDTHYRDSLDEDFNEETFNGAVANGELESYKERCQDRFHAAMKDWERFNTARLHEMSPLFKEEEFGAEIPRVLVHEEDKGENEDGQDHDIPSRFRRVGVFGFRHFRDDESFMRDAVKREILLI